MRRATIYINGTNIRSYCFEDIDFDYYFEEAKVKIAGIELQTGEAKKIIVSRNDQVAVLIEEE